MSEKNFLVDPTRLCQVEIKVGDIERASNFYERTFGWSIVPAHIHNYVILKVPEDCPFGISLIPGKAPSTASDSSSRIVLYFRTSDPESIVSKAIENGGKKVLERDLPSYGHIFQIADPDGQIFGLYKG